MARYLPSICLLCPPACPLSLSACSACLACPPAWLAGWHCLPGLHCLLATACLPARSVCLLCRPPARPLCLPGLPARLLCLPACSACLPALSACRPCGRYPSGRPRSAASSAAPCLSPCLPRSATSPGNLARQPFAVTPSGSHSMLDRPLASCASVETGPPPSCLTNPGNAPHGGRAGGRCPPLCRARRSAVPAALPCPPLCRARRSAVPAALPCPPGPPASPRAFQPLPKLPRQDASWCPSLPATLRPSPASTPTGNRSAASPSRPPAPHRGPGPRRHPDPATHPRLRNPQHHPPQP
jgi:hypothetical protein